MTVRIDHDLDPFALGARSGLLWARHGRILAGVGEYARIPLGRPQGFEAAMAALAGLTGRDEVGRPGSGPVAFAALPFDPDAHGELIVPRLVVGASTSGHRWITEIVEVPDDDREPVSTPTDQLVAQAMAVGAHPRSGLQPTRLVLESTLPPEYWRDEIVGHARQAIRDGRLDKAVLARELTVSADTAFDPSVIMARLARTFPQANLFLIDGFFAASPETLVARLDDMVRAHPLAGTLPRSNDPDQDRRLAAELVASTKNQWEHRIVIDWLLDNLLPFCSYVDAEPEPSIVSLANVHHLGTKVEGRLSSPPASVLELVAALHPTPAVGGDPQKDALSLIAELEQADRGCYAGPAGWVDAHGNGEFAVSVRSAQFEAADRVRLFAGVGVVADSDLEAELEETRAKFQAILGALIRP
jgi:menaquinone-specific isochorismate synthase